MLSASTLEPPSSFRSHSDNIAPLDEGVHRALLLCLLLVEVDVEVMY